jgi:hypothetical protein
VCGEFACHGRRDGAHSGGAALDHHAGLVTAGQECLVGDEEVDRDWDFIGVAGLAAGDASDEGVGHDLSGPTLVPGRLGGFCVLLELCIGLDALLHRHQRGQVDHQIRGRAHADAPLRGGLRVALHGRVHVELGGELLDTGGQSSGAGPGQRRETGGSADLLVDLGTVLLRQVGGLPDQQGCAPLREHPGAQSVERVRHPGHPDARRAQEPGTRMRAAPQRRTDLVGHTTTPPLSTNALLGLAGPSGFVQRDSQPRLRRRHSVLHCFELAEQVHPLRLHHLRDRRPGVGGAWQDHARQQLPHGSDPRDLNRSTTPGQHRPGRLIACPSRHLNCHVIKISHTRSYRSPNPTCLPRAESGARHGPT